MNPYSWHGALQEEAYIIQRNGRYVAQVSLMPDLPFHSAILNDWCNSLWLAELGQPLATERRPVVAEQNPDVADEPEPGHALVHREMTWQGVPRLTPACVCGWYSPNFSHAEYDAHRRRVGSAT